MKLVFATNNQYKLQEVRGKIDSGLQITGLNDEEIFEDIPETQNTIEGNAQQKADYIFRNYKLNCFADDTGLEIEILNGAPGVYSARYAGPECSFEDNINKVLTELNGITNRKAQFRTVICLIVNGARHFFEGKINGLITEVKKGGKGFGYDPIFQPEGSDLTFAQMSLEEKNKISHRALAVNKLVEFFQLIK